MYLNSKLNVSRDWNNVFSKKTIQYVDFPSLIYSQYFQNGVCTRIHTNIYARLLASTFPFHMMYMHVRFRAIG